MVGDDKMLENGHLFEGLNSDLSCSTVLINLKLVFKTYPHPMINLNSISINLLSRCHLNSFHYG